jgi:hypothetical protein
LLTIVTDKNYLESKGDLILGSPFLFAGTLDRKNISQLLGRKRLQKSG